jgi:hypothetical protein
MIIDRAAVIELDQKNPKADGSKSNARFEIYKAAKTVGAYFDLGGLTADLRFDASHGYLRGLDFSDESKKRKGDAPKRKKRKKKCSRTMPMRFDGVVGFGGASKDHGTIVDVNSETVTVQPESQRAAPISILRSGFKASILADAPPTAIECLAPTAIYVAHLEITLAPLDSVEALIDDELRYVVVFGEGSNRSLVKCLVWRRADARSCPPSSRSPATSRQARSFLAQTPFLS